MIEVGASLNAAMSAGAGFGTLSMAMVMLSIQVSLLVSSLVRRARVSLAPPLLPATLRSATAHGIGLSTEVAHT